MEAVTLAKTPISSLQQVKDLAQTVDPEIYFRAPLEIELEKIESGPIGLKELKAAADILDQQVAHLTGVREEMDSPLEASARARVDLMRQEIEREARQVKKSIQNLKQMREARIASVTKAMFLAAKYPCIEFNKVPWINGHDLQIIPIPMRAKATTIVVQGSEWAQILFNGMSDSPDTYNLTGCLVQIYEPALKRKRNKELTFRYPGIIPKRVKERVKEAESDFYSAGSDSAGCILMLADVSLLDVTERDLPKDLDPLMVGYHPLCPEKLWLIDSFDMTPVEILISKEALATFEKLRADT